MRRSLIGLVLAAAFAPAAYGQQAVTVDVSDGAVQRFEIGGPARIVYTGSTVTITFGPAPSPTPTPAPAPPGPVPTPDPLPVAPKQPGKAIVTLVYDPATETIAQARIRADLATDGILAGLNARFRAYGIGDEAVDRLNIRKSLLALPCVLVQWLPDGKDEAPVFAVLPAVKDKAAVIDAVRKAAK